MRLDPALRALALLAAAAGLIAAAHLPPSAATTSETDPDREAMLGMMAKLGDVWTPNCAMPGFSETRPTVRFRLNRDGLLEGDPRLAQPGGDEAGREAGRLALEAVTRAQPFVVTPRLIGRDIELGFDARRACARGPS